MRAGVGPARLPLLQGRRLANSRTRGGKRDLRVLPTFVVHLVLEAALLVVALGRSHFQHFGLVQELMMEAESLFILSIGRLRHRCRGHVCLLMTILCCLVRQSRKQKQKQPRTQRGRHSEMRMPRSCLKATLKKRPGVACVFAVRQRGGRGHAKHVRAQR